MDRFQSIVYNPTQSSYVPIRWEVPQGSILGPVLFLCLLVDLPDIICVQNTMLTVFLKYETDK